MRRNHGLCFDFLETRTLLSRLHHVPASAGPSVPLVLDGTLTVNNSSPMTTENDDGSTTTSVPVKGQLGSLGVVRGYWNESVDEYGDYLGPDTLQLRTAKGTFLVAFGDASPGPVHRQGKGDVFYQHAQRVYSPTGAYKGDAESGTIDLVMNRSQTLVASLRLQTQST